MKLYFKVLVLCLLSTAVIAQSKSELKNEVSTLKTELSKIKKEKQELKQLLVNKEIINKDLQAKLRLYKDSLATLNASIQINTGKTQGNDFSVSIVKATTREQKKDSLLLSSLTERSQAYETLLEPTPSSYKAIAKKEALFDQQACSNCLKFQTFQSLFIETAYIEYELMSSSNTFSGFYKYKYVPEFGEMKFAVKKIEGSYKKAAYGLELIIMRVDGSSVNVNLQHHTDKPRKSTLKANGLDLQQFYTKEVPLSKMDILECR